MNFTSLFLENEFIFNLEQLLTNISYECREFGSTKSITLY